MKILAKHRIGFTFVEILLAVMLLAVAVVPLLTFVHRITHQTTTTRTRIIAQALAASIIERYRTEPVSVLTTLLKDATAGARAIEADTLLSISPVQMNELQSVSRLKRTVFYAPVNDREGVLNVVILWEEDGGSRRYEVRGLVTDTYFPVGR